MGRLSEEEAVFGVATEEGIAEDRSEVEEDAIGFGADFESLSFPTST